MSHFTADASHFTLGGAYYPTDHVFAMFPDISAAQAAARRLTGVPGIGRGVVAAPADILQAFASRAAEVGGAPSVGREDQFMLRFVELARAGRAGLLIEVAKSDVAALGAALTASRAELAYHYRALVIEELVQATPRAEAAAAGRL
jgi:hypothetical protein